MKKWLRPVSIAVLVIGIAYAVCYESATHIGRGWLRGEAFYDGRPTSLWRLRIDGWIERFDSPREAGRMVETLVVPNAVHEPIDPEDIIGWVPPMKPAKQTPWTRFRDFFHADDENVAGVPILTAHTTAVPLHSRQPRILWGHPDAEAVLLELAKDAKYQPVTRRPLRTIRAIKAIPPQE